MNDNARQQSVKAYFDGIATKDMSQVPWAQDATLRTPLNPAGGESELIRGRQAILDFFNSILPAVRSVKFLHYYTGNDDWVAGQAEIGLANGKTLYVSNRVAGTISMLDADTLAVTGAIRVTTTSRNSRST